jgi:hypothetical protein
MVRYRHGRNPSPANRPLRFPALSKDLSELLVGRGFRNGIQPENPERLLWELFPANFRIADPRELSMTVTPSQIAISCSQ